MELMINSDELMMIGIVAGICIITAGIFVLSTWEE
jgi:hypothetical protein